MCSLGKKRLFVYYHTVSIIKTITRTVIFWLLYSVQTIFSKELLSIKGSRWPREVSSLTCSWNDCFTSMLTGTRRRCSEQNINIQPQPTDNEHKHSCVSKTNICKIANVCKFDAEVYSYKEWVIWILIFIITIHLTCTKVNITDVICTIGISIVLQCIFW